MILPVILIITIIPAYTQTRTEKFVLSVTDTSLSEYQQAQQIYEWITQNIKYDVKSYKNHAVTDRTTGEVLKQKKALCFEYSRVFDDMCHAVGIKSFTVYGYSKGFGYQEGQDFYKTNHTWNVLILDSSYVLLDPTWGSGSLEYKPDFTAKILNTLFKKPYVDHKIKFHHQPTSEYFDIDPDKLAKTHLPLSPEWQLKDPALSYKGFVTSDSVAGNNSNYKNELKWLTKNSNYYRHYLEGIKGKEFNSNNNFDVAVTAYNLANNNHYFSKEVNTDNIASFKYNLDLYTSAGKHLTEHKYKTDSVYQVQKTSLKYLDKNTIKLSDKIRKKEERAKKTLRKSLLKLDKKEFQIDSKIYKYEEKVIDLEDKKFVKKKRGKSPDNECQVYDILVELAWLETLQNNMKPAIEKSFTGIDTCIKQQKEICIDIFSIQKKMHEDILKTREMVSGKNDILLIGLLDTVYSDYNGLLKLYGRQKFLNAGLGSVSREYYQKTAELEKLYKNEINLFKKLLPLSYYSDSTIAFYRTSLDKLIQEYERIINFNYQLIEYNSILMAYKIKDRKALKELKKDSKKELQYISKYVNQRKKWIDGEYKKDKMSISQLARSVKNEETILRKKILEFESKNRESSLISK